MKNILIQNFFSRLKNTNIFLFFSIKNQKNTGEFRISNFGADFWIFDLRSVIAGNRRQIRVLCGE